MCLRCNPCSTGSILARKVRSPRRTRRRTRPRHTSPCHGRSRDLHTRCSSRRRKWHPRRRRRRRSCEGPCCSSCRRRRHCRWRTPCPRGQGTRWRTRRSALRRSANRRTSDRSASYSRGTTPRTLAGHRPHSGRRLCRKSRSGSDRSRGSWCRPSRSRRSSRGQGRRRRQRIRFSSCMPACPARRSTSRSSERRTRSSDRRAARSRRCTSSRRRGIRTVWSRRHRHRRPVPQEGDRSSPRGWRNSRRR